MIGYVVLVELATRQNGNAPGFKIIRSDIVARGRGTLVQRQNFPIRAGVKRVAGGGGDQRNVRADRGALETWNPLQRRESFFHETLAGGDIGIWRLWQRDQADPHIFGTEPNALPAQLHKAGDEQGRAGEQRDRQCDLRADQNFAEPVLLDAPTRSAPPFFQSVNQIGPRTFQGRINSHGHAC